MRRWLCSALLLLLPVCGLAQQAAPGPVGPPQGPWRQQDYWLPMTDANGVARLLFARLCRPAGEAPARVVEIAHGVAPEIRDRLALRPIDCDSEAARWFLDRGYVVIEAVRRGFGATGGAFAELPGPCDSRRDYRRAALEAARDLAATLDYAATLPFARPTGMVVVGQSAGGMATIALNSQPHPRVSAMINMAGGLGGHYRQQANSNCMPDLLAQTIGRLAQGATTPMLWLYAANDSFFAPALAAQLYAAYAANGGQAEFIPLGAYGNDGHRLFFGRGGSLIWGPLFDRYLADRPQQ